MDGAQMSRQVLQVLNRYVALLVRGWCMFAACVQPGSTIILHR